MMLLHEPQKPYVKKDISYFMIPDKTSLLALPETEKTVSHEPRSLKEILEKMGLVEK